LIRVVRETRQARRIRSGDPLRGAVMPASTQATWPAAFGLFCGVVLSLGLMHPRLAGLGSRPRHASSPLSSARGKPMSSFTTPRLDIYNSPASRKLSRWSSRASVIREGEEEEEDNEPQAPVDLIEGRSFCVAGYLSMGSRPKVASRVETCRCSMLDARSP